MRTQSSDTHPEAARVQIELLRQMGPEGRARLAFSLSRTGMQLSWRALEEANPEATEDELKVLFVAYNYGEDLARRFAAYLQQRQARTNRGAGQASPGANP